MGIDLQDFDVSDEDYKRAKKAAINGDKEYITKDGETHFLSRADRRALKSSRRRDITRKRTVPKVPDGIWRTPD